MKNLVCVPGEQLVSRQRPTRFASTSSLWRLGFALGLALVVSVAGSAAAQKVRLSKKYKKWLREEVVYIISKDEKEVFLKLVGEVEHEHFIQEFWDLRDPTPATPENEYKQEHYKRIEYTNRYFGFADGIEGWRTDRGRIYIQLGKPQQRAQYPWLGEIRPIELWFYSRAEFPSLPNAFSVMFFQPDSTSGYRLYSPYLDGPDKLVTRTGAENDPQGSYKFLRRVNMEIARASLTLLTDEPIDREGFTASLGSDSMLTRIRNLPNDKFTKEMLERRRRLRDLVKSRLIQPVEMDVLAVPLRDSGGESYVHFLLLLPETLDQLVRKDKKQTLVASTVSVLVRNANMQKLFQQSHGNQFHFSDSDFARKRQWPVGYEDRLPLPPGDYAIDFVFRNELTQVVYQTQQRVQVPAADPIGLQVSPLVVYDDVHRSDPRQGPLPFHFSNLKFVPTLRRKFTASEKLSIFFQISDPSAGPSSASGGVLKIEYTLGSLARGGPRQEVSQEIQKQEFTSHGTVFHGKSLSLSEFPSGSYRLVVKVTDPVTRQWASQSLAFRVVPGSVQTKRVVLLNGQVDKDLQAGLIDYRRGLCEAAAKRPEAAIRYFQNALSQNPGLQEARNRLVELSFQQGRFEQVAALLPPEGLTIETDLASARRFVHSLEKIGNVARAIELAERGLRLYGPRLPLYEDLLRLYEQSGQSDRAEKVREQIRRLGGT